MNTNPRQDNLAGGFCVSSSLTVCGCNKNILRPYRLVVRIGDSHSSDWGSIPHRASFSTRYDKSKGCVMETVIVEIRAAEGGDDAKLLVQDQLKIYDRACTLKGY